MMQCLTMVQWREYFQQYMTMQCFWCTQKTMDCQQCFEYLDGGVLQWT